ncbi:hypothetical protein BJX66DRAFT_112326 [Aspergillus keveii]|uniref:C2H2-type domain-containing protein n=1 Tax=Aspergillus keveii TaxID=714993 RepID=A0ABR4FKT1_9EURO
MDDASGMDSDVEYIESDEGIGEELYDSSNKSKKSLILVSSSVARKKGHGHGRRTDASAQIYQCTFCENRFKKKEHWARHEQIIHLPKNRWTCSPDGPTVKGWCVFCGLRNPPPEHKNTEHNYDRCRLSAKRTFRERRCFEYHIRTTHGASPEEWMESWCTRNTRDITSRCGFCRKELSTWSARIDHVAVHFEQGFVMNQWNGDWGLEPFLQQQVRRAILPQNRNQTIRVTQSSAEPRVISYPCTICKKSFRFESGWETHERSTHLPFDEWTCSPQGGILNGCCVFCGATNPDVDHLDSNHFYEKCRGKVNTFKEKRRLFKHIRTTHKVEPNELMGMWQIPLPKFKSRCGFCESYFETWPERAIHLASHFRTGYTMAEWHGDLGFDDHVQNCLKTATRSYVTTRVSTPASPESRRSKSSGPSIIDIEPLLRRKLSEHHNSCIVADLPPTRMRLRSGKALISFDEHSHDSDPLDVSVLPTEPYVASPGKTDWPENIIRGSSASTVSGNSLRRRQGSWTHQSRPREDCLASVGSGVTGFQAEPREIELALVVSSPPSPTSPSDVRVISGQLEGNTEKHIENAITTITGTGSASSERDSESEDGGGFIGNLGSFDISYQADDDWLTEGKQYFQILLSLYTH